MIIITDKYVKEGKLNKKTLVEFGGDAVEFDGDNITFKTNVKFWLCDSLTSVYGTTFNNPVKFVLCESLASVAGATFKKGFKAISCPNLKQ